MHELATVQPGMRELSVDEVSQVSGGMIPILVYAGGALLGAGVVAAGYYLSRYW